VQTLLGHIERWLAYSQAPLENSAGEKVNGLTPILADVDEFQPRKVEELVPEKNIAPETYLIYPNGGYHPFYGVFNTLPIYQQKIWPYVKRIKFAEVWKSKENLDRLRAHNLRENQKTSQVNASMTAGGYATVILDTTGRFLRVETNKLEQGRKPVRLHRLVALAWILNPENKKNVMHLDDNPTSYLIENLKWGTASENSRGKKMRNPDTLEQKYLNLVNKGVIKG